MDLAPIILFVYNRPEHTLKTLTALNKNKLASQSELFIYADGEPENANTAMLEKVKHVRQIIKSKKWCLKNNIIEMPNNNGIGNMEVNAVTDIVNKYGKVIVLEDDIVTTEGFLTYMNEALDLYQNENEVMHISGYMFPVKEVLPETFFYNSTSCWGWGTWQRAWSSFNPNSMVLKAQLDIKNDWNQFTINNTASFDKLLIQNIAIEKDFENDEFATRKNKKWNWDVCWYASVFLNNGLCLHPKTSLVKNIGHDNTGVHCNNHWGNKIYKNQKTINFIDVKKIELKENESARNAVTGFYKSLGKPPIHIRIKEKIKNIFK